MSEHHDGPKLSKEHSPKEERRVHHRVAHIFSTHFAIIIIVATFISWRLFFMTRNHDVIWDEAVYLGIGKFLWSAGSAGLWEIIRPLGLPLIIGLPWKLGLNQIFWAELIAILFSAGCLILTYLLGTKLYSRTVGALAALLLSMTPTFFLYSGYILTDIPSTFFLLLSLILFVEGRYAFAGLLTGVTFMIRYPHGLAMIALGGLLGAWYLMDRSDEKRLRHLGEYLGFFSILPLFYMIINWILYHNETSKAWHAIFRPWILASWHAGNPAEGATSSLFYISGILGENFLLTLSLLGLAWLIIRKEHRELRTITPLVVLVVYIFYFSSILNKQMRFSMPLLPLLSLFSARGLIETSDWIAFAQERKKIIRSVAVIAVLVCLWLFIYPEDQKYYGWRFEQPQPVVSEIYSYFESQDIRSVVLTADPLPAAYSSKKFEPFYFSVDSTARIYDDTIADAWGVLYVPEAFYCDHDDKNCNDGLAALEQKIQRDNTLVLERTYGRDDVGFRTYQIWKRKAIMDY